MKYQVIIDEQCQEKILIYAHERTKLIEDIEQLILNDDNLEIIGSSNKTFIKLDTADIFCFVVENNKVFAITDKEKLHIKYRIYQLENNLPDNFVKINQSCIANIKKISRFDASVTGTLTVVFKNGYKDYVSRRQLKFVKERLGL